MNENIFSQPHQPQEVIFKALSEEQASLLEASLEDLALSSSNLKENRDSSSYCLTFILDGNQREELDRRISNLKQHFDVPTPSVSPLRMQDWVSLVQKHFKPIRSGRYYIYGSHIETPPPLGSVPILLDAGAAFGTGEHETTSGCLKAIDALCAQRRFSRILDMGCGSGVLAIAAAKSQPVPVTAIDNDAVSVSVARENVRRNQVNAQVRLQCGNGYQAGLVHGEYDLIIANILARPLMRMAKDLRRHLAPDGRVVLSGLLIRQEQMVLWAHKQAGLRLVERRRLGPWSVLVLRG